MTRTLTLKSLDKAQRRMVGIRNLKLELNLGKGLSMSEFSTQVETLQGKLDAYNAMVNALAQQREEIETMERSLRGTSERMLGAVASIYGKESDEYEVAGGVKRVRLRKRKPAEATDGSAETAGAAIGT
jgi:hypothetical protein